MSSESQAHERTQSILVRGEQRVASGAVSADSAPHEIDVLDAVSGNLGAALALDHVRELYPRGARRIGCLQSR